MGKIRNVFIKQHPRARWRYHWGDDEMVGCGDEVIFLSIINKRLKVRLSSDF